MNVPTVRYVCRVAPGLTASALSLRHLDRQGINPLLVWQLQTAALPFDKGRWHPAHPRTCWHLWHVQHTAAARWLAHAKQASVPQEPPAVSADTLLPVQKVSTTTLSTAKLVESLTMKVTASACTALFGGSLLSNGTCKLTSSRKHQPPCSVFSSQRGVLTRHFDSCQDFCSFLLV